MARASTARSTTQEKLEPGAVTPAQRRSSTGCRKGLEPTRDILNTDVEDLVRGRRPLEPEDLDAIEEALIAADLGPARDAAGDGGAARAERADLDGRRAEAMRGAAARGDPRQSSTGPRAVAPFSARPWVVFVVGVNGVGKTTTIGKLAARLEGAKGRTTLLCAADTFRAAAAEQLEVWAERTGAPFHRGAEGADPAAVLTDALRAARSRGLRRRARGHRRPPAHQGQPDGGAGQDGARGRARGPGRAARDAARARRHRGLQRRSPRAASSPRRPGVTGLVLTKLDGTAKGGVAVAVVRELGVPIRYVGVGESRGGPAALRRRRLRRSARRVD